MVMGRDVRVEYHGRDRYGRIVGKILVDGRDACLAQVRSGMAWHYKKSTWLTSPLPTGLPMQSRRTAPGAAGKVSGLIPMPTSMGLQAASERTLRPVSSLGRRKLGGDDEVVVCR